MKRWEARYNFMKMNGLMNWEKKETKRNRIITTKKTISVDDKDKYENKIITNKKVVIIFIVKDKMSP